MEKILIEWERRDTYRVALDSQEAQSYFGTSDPLVLTGLLATDDEDALEGIRALEDDWASGHGSRKIHVQTGGAAERGEGLFWLTESNTPDEHTGPFPSADDAFEYWEDQ